jgi:hypothetical protein
MSAMTSYSSRKGEVPVGDDDLYAFLTDMRNFKPVIPNGLLDEWQATADRCSFKIDRVGKVSASLSEALPHSIITYNAETLFTGKIAVQVVIEPLSRNRSSFYITAGLNMNPLMRMLVGDSAGTYLGKLIDAIESYGGYDKIRGCSRPL